MSSFLVYISPSFSISLTQKNALNFSMKFTPWTSAGQSMKHTSELFFAFINLYRGDIFQLRTRRGCFSPLWSVGQYSVQVSLCACPVLSSLPKLLVTVGNRILSKWAEDQIWSDPACPFQDYVIFFNRRAWNITLISCILWQLDTVASRWKATAVTQLYPRN